MRQIEIPRLFDRRLKGRHRNPDRPPDLESHTRHRSTASGDWQLRSLIGAKHWVPPGLCGGQWQAVPRLQHLSEAHTADLSVARSAAPKEASNVSDQALAALHGSINASLCRSMSLTSSNTHKSGGGYNTIHSTRSEVKCRGNLSILQVLYHRLTDIRLSNSRLHLLSRSRLNLLTKAGIGIAPIRPFDTGKVYGCPRSSIIPSVGPSTNGLEHTTHTTAFAPNSAHHLALRSTSISPKKPPYILDGSPNRFTLCDDLLASRHARNLANILDEIYATLTVTAPFAPTTAIDFLSFQSWPINYQSLTQNPSVLDTYTQTLNSTGYSQGSPTALAFAPLVTGRSDSGGSSHAEPSPSPFFRPLRSVSIDARSSTCLAIEIQDLQPCFSNGNQGPDSSPPESPPPESPPPEGPPIIPFPDPEYD